MSNKKIIERWSLLHIALILSLGFHVHNRNRPMHRWEIELVRSGYKQILLEIRAKYRNIGRWKRIEITKRGVSLYPTATSKFLSKIRFIKKWAQERPYEAVFIAISLAVVIGLYLNGYEAGFLTVGVAKFWVGGDGLWSDPGAAHWSLATGGAAGAAKPAIGDTVDVDANSGAPTITLDEHTANGLGDVDMSAGNGTLQCDGNPWEFECAGECNLSDMILSDTDFDITMTGTGTLTLQGGQTCGDLTINTAGIITLGSGDIYVDFTITAGELRQNGYNIALTGDWTNGDTFTHQGIVTFQSAGAAKQQITSGGSNLGAIVVNCPHATGGVTFLDAFRDDNGCTLTDGELLGNAVAVRHNWINIAAGTVYSATSGTTTIDDETAGGYLIDNVGTFTHNNGKVLSTYAAGFNISSNDIGLFDFENTAGVANVGDVALTCTINNDLDITGGTFLLNGGTVNVSGNMTVSAGKNFYTGGANTNIAITGSVTLDGRWDADYISATTTVSFGNMTVNNAGRFYTTSSTNAITNGGITINNGGLVEVTAGSHITFDNTGTTTIANGGTLTINVGTVLVSDVPTVQYSWNAILGSTVTVTGTRVTDCDASTGETIMANDGTCRNGGNNLNWDFGDGTPTSTGTVCVGPRTPIFLTKTQMTR